MDTGESARTRPETSRPVDGAQAPAIVPWPQVVEVADGEPFHLGPGVRVVAGPQPGAVSAGVLVANVLGRLVGSPVAVVQEDDGAGAAVVLELVDVADLPLPPGLDAGLASSGYQVVVTAQRVHVRAASGTGLLHGAVTVQQATLPAGVAGTGEVPPLRVVDWPRFAWRGLCLDVARHFFGLDDLERLVDLLLQLKLNVLHLHLTDDQGWRLDVPSRPALAAVSGRTAVDGDPGGHLSAEQYAHLTSYAATRGITVIPEIDLPGHVNAALHAVGELTPSGEPAREYTGIDVGFSRLHLDLPTTRPFLHDVLGDVAAMTPGPYVHIGGDEVLTMEPAEYRGFVEAAVAEIRAAGKRVVGWQEVAGAVAEMVAEGGSADDVVVQYWDEREGAEEVTRVARVGAGVVLSPATRVYLDMKYDAGTPLGLEWAGHVPLRQAYEWEPADVLPGVPPDRLLGVEAALWTETVRAASDLYTLLLPRLAAAAEVAWTAPERRRWEDFAQRLPRHAAQWGAAGLRWFAAPEVDWSL